MGTERTKNSKLSDAELCRKNGWKRGTLLREEGYDPAIIRITAVGKKSIRAERVSFAGEPVEENVWTIKMRDWKRVERGKP